MHRPRPLRPAHRVLSHLLLRRTPGALPHLGRADHDACPILLQTAPDRDDHRCCRSGDEAVTTSGPDNPSAPAGQQGPSLDQVRALWPAVIDEVKSRSRVAWMTVSQSVPVSVGDGTVAAAIADAGAVNHFRRTAYPALVGEALLAVLRTRLSFELVLDPGQPPGTQTDTARGMATATHLGSRRRRPRREQHPQDLPPTRHQSHRPHPDGRRMATSSTTLVDAGPTLTGVALIEVELGGQKIDEYEEAQPCTKVSRRPDRRARPTARDRL